MSATDETAAGSPEEDSGKAPRAVLESLTGPSKGKLYWLSDDTLSATVRDDRSLHFERPTEGVQSADKVAELQWQDGSYSLHAADGRHVWVNGHRVETITLMHGDMIEFDELGPMTRFRLPDRAFQAHRSVDDIVSDAIAYTRTSRRPLPRRVSTALGDSLHRMTHQTTVFFRVSVLLSLCALLVLGAVLYRNDKQMQHRLEQDAHRIEAVTLLLAQTRDDALSREDLTQLRTQLESQLTQNTERLGALERRPEEAAEILGGATPSIGFVQGAFGLRHMASGALLRNVLGPDGTPLQTPFGQPRIEPRGDGPPAEFQFTGTAFLLGDGQHFVTNRHVAVPWTSGDRLQTFEASGLQPEMLKMFIYLPDRAGPIEARLVQASDTVDLAVLSIAPLRMEGRGLVLSDTPLRVGQEIYLLGYPTGLKALLAQAGPAFLKSFGDGEEINFWTVAARLSERNLIKPLASRGIVAQVNSGAVIYDAETTVGGSGGPALNRSGQVVAINAAILPEFGGSNLGVPVQQLLPLLTQIDGD